MGASPAGTSAQWTVTAGKSALGAAVHTHQEVTRVRKPPRSQKAITWEPHTLPHRPLVPRL